MLILFVLHVSGVAQMGFSFAQQQSVEVNDALAAMLTVGISYQLSSTEIMDMHVAAVVELSGKTCI